MELFLFSTLAVGIAEVGDRSLLLAILFGIRYPNFWPIFWGMATGLFVNQALSALVGVWLFTVISPEWHAWLVGIAFLVMAIWVLIPEDDEVKENLTARSLFLTSALAFFILEMADKTQLVVVTLAGASKELVPVVLGATLGILLVTAPALWLGNRFAAWLPVRKIRFMAAALFLILACWTLTMAVGWVPQASLLDLGPFLDTLRN